MSSEEQNKLAAIVAAILAGAAAQSGGNIENKAMVDRYRLLFKHIQDTGGPLAKP